MLFSAATIVHYAFNVSELKSLLEWYNKPYPASVKSWLKEYRKIWYKPVHARNKSTERKTLQRCFYFLNASGRSFAMVIEELHPELLASVTVFYLILRALDTIEDDMTIHVEEKETLLRDFHNILEQRGWTFDGNGPDENDRQLCVEFDTVIEEFLRLKPKYQTIIRDITEKMGNGMADYIQNSEHQFGIRTVSEYDVYCYYVAGLVGEGLTRLFVEARLAKSSLLEQSHLHKSMGLFLQKTNIIRDIREDHDDRRSFWPKEVWCKHVESFEDLFDLAHRDEALACSSEMILNAMEHIPDCLHYLAGLEEQSIFNFCAIPQAMAIATLELLYQNPALFKRNVKLSKGKAFQVIMQSTQGLKQTCEVFREHTRKILRKTKADDPHFDRIKLLISRTEQCIGCMFPADALQRESRQRDDSVVKNRDGPESWGTLVYIVLAIYAALIAFRRFKSDD